MSLRCELFGHKPPVHHGPHSMLGGGDYMEVRNVNVDVIGRVHFTLFGMCGRCGEHYKVGMLHEHEITNRLKEPSHDNQ